MMKTQPASDNASASLRGLPAQNHSFGRLLTPSTFIDEIVDFFCEAYIITRSSLQHHQQRLVHNTAE